MAEIDEQLAPIEERIETCGLEDATVLMEIQDMALKRASAVDVNLTALTFDRQFTVLQKLINLKSMVYALAPKFINMDYPYWDLNWYEFPKNYSAEYRYYHGTTYRDDIADDEEHNLNSLPQVGASFDDESMAIYRKFLKNLVYWLRRFRYVWSTRSWWDETYYRQWEWKKWANTSTLEYEYSALEQHHSLENVDASTLATLISSGEGVVYRTNPHQNPSNSISVDINSALGVAKYYDHTWNGPLKLIQEEDVGTQSPRNIENIPHNLMTPNPSCFTVEGLWFVVPNFIPTWTHTNAVITELDSGTSKTWGSQSQYSATQYSSTASSAVTETFTYRRNEPKRTVYETIQRNESGTGHHTKTSTRWSSDGTRSYEYEHINEPDSYSPDSSNTWKEEKYVYPTFGGLVPPLTEGVLPCFSIGEIAPHTVKTFTVCDQHSLPTDYPIPTLKFPQGETFVWNRQSSCSIRYSGSTKWFPVLDFGDFVIPEPEEP